MALAETGDLPAAPELPAHLMYVWRAWSRLSRERPWYGGGLGPATPGVIPWASVVAWADFHDMPGSAVAYLDRCFQKMDEVFFAWHAARTK